MQVVSFKIRRIHIGINHSFDSGTIPDLDVRQSEIEPRAGPSTIGRHDAGQQRSEELVEEPLSVSFRASTSVQPFLEHRLQRLDTEVQKLLQMNYLAPSSRLPYNVPRQQQQQQQQQQQEQPEQQQGPLAEMVARDARSTPIVVKDDNPMPAQPNEEVSARSELEQLHARLIAMIECPVCFEPIAPPIHQCRRGHLVSYRH